MYNIQTIAYLGSIEQEDVFISIFLPINCDLADYGSLTPHIRFVDIIHGVDFLQFINQSPMPWYEIDRENRPTTPYARNTADLGPKQAKETRSNTECP
jgi:hypothetical protein